MGHLALVSAAVDGVRIGVFAVPLVISGRKCDRIPGGVPSPMPIAMVPTMMPVIMMVISAMIVAIPPTPRLSFG